MMQSNFDFDTEKLAAYLERHVLGFAGPLVAEKFSGGQSNPTFKITTARDNMFCVARPRGSC